MTIFDCKKLLETAETAGEDKILAEIQFRVDEYRRDLQNRFRRKEDLIIISSEAKRFRCWLVNSLRRGIRGAGSVFGASFPSCLSDEEIRNEISVEVEMKLEEYREEMKRKYRRSIDQPLLTNVLERYREWLLTDAVGQQGSRYYDFSLKMEEMAEPVKQGRILDNRYEIVSTIETASHRGCLYKAFDRRLQCVTAIRKILFPLSIGDEGNEQEKRFIDEANLLFNLHHSGLPKVSDFFIGPDPETEKKAFFLVMTFIEGQSLEALMKERQGKPLSEEEAKIYFRQILDILAFLNSRIPPVIYQDMKPSNVVVHGRTAPLAITDSGSLKVGRVFLMDFGVARILSGVGESIVGSRPANDLYSLATLIYFLLTGRTVQVDFSTNERPEPVCRVNGQVSEEFSNIIMTIMDNFSSGRPDTPERIISLLDGRRKPESSIKSGLTTGSSQSLKIEDFSEGATSSIKKNLSSSPGIAGDAVRIRADSLFQAVRDGDLVALEELLESGRNVDEKNPDGLSALHVAASLNLPGIINILIGAGININEKDRRGRTAVHLAAVAGGREAVEVLIKRGADLSLKDHDGMTALHLSNHRRNQDISVLLMEAWSSSIYNDEEDSSETSSYRGETNNDGFTELHQAAYSGNADLVEKLIKQGFFVDPRSDYGLTPLHRAAAAGSMETAKLLIQRGADPSAVDVYGNRPSDAAKKAGHLELAEFIEEQKESDVPDGEEGEDIWNSCPKEGDPERDDASGVPSFSNPSC